LHSNAVKVIEKSTFPLSKTQVTVILSGTKNLILILQIIWSTVIIFN